jgi:simple sugar transport system permease protein
MTHRRLEIQVKKTKKKYGFFRTIYAENKTLLFLLAAVFIFLSIFLPSRFLTLFNFQSMATQIPEFGLLAMGVMIAMLMGGIDLSVVSIASVSGIIAAKLMTGMIKGGVPPGQTGYVVLLAIAAAIGVSAVCGLVNGIVVGYLRVNPVIATIGTNSLFMGVGIIITSSRGIIGFPDAFLFIGNGFLWIFPFPVVIFIALALFVTVVLNRTKFGIQTRMIGTNQKAAYFANIDISLTYVKVYLLSGILSGISSLIMISRVNSAKSGYGESYLLETVLVSILGGVDPRGGYGKISGLVIALVTLQFLKNGSNILNFTPFVKNIISGSLLILVMVINSIGAARSVKTEPSKS